MRLRATAFAAGVLFTLPSGAQQSKTKPLTDVYHNNDFQFTGITLSKSGRMFINFPRWSDRYLNAVVEVMKDGSVKPFPDEFWNRWDMKPETAAKQFVCVQSVVADNTDSLWVLDPAAPLLASVVRGGAKLVKIDLKSNQVSRTISFGPDIAMPKSYLNDIRIDTGLNVAYITDSGAGGIVVVDLGSGKARRVLDGHPSVMAEQGISISVNAKPVQANGKPPQFNSDGIALSPDGSYLYYQALTGSTLYRVKTAVLRDAGAKKEAIQSSVEKVAKTFPVDGLWIDAQGRVYLSDINRSAVSRLSPGGQIETLAADRRLQWPDTFSQGPDGAIYVTSSHINDMPRFNEGKSARTMPYTVFRLTP